MCSGQYDGAVKADIILDGGAQISQFGAGGADSAKDFARQTKPVDDFIVQSLLIAPTRAVVEALVYSLAITPVRR